MLTVQWDSLFCSDPLNWDYSTLLLYVYVLQTIYLSISPPKLILTPFLSTSKFTSNGSFFPLFCHVWLFYHFTFSFPCKNLSSSVLYILIVCLFCSILILDRPYYSPPLLLTRALKGPMATNSRLLFTFSNEWKNRLVFTFFNEWLYEQIWSGY